MKVVFGLNADPRNPERTGWFGPCTDLKGRAKTKSGMWPIMDIRPGLAARGVSDPVRGASAWEEDVEPDRRPVAGHDARGAG